MTTEDKSSGSFYGNWITLLMMYVLFFTAGLGFYTFQVFVPRLVEDFGWSATQTIGAAAIWAVVFGLSGFFVGGWIQRFGAKRVILIGTIGGAVLFFASSMITQLWHLYLVLLFSGVTVAATTLVPAQTVITLWFNKKRGRNMGLAMMGVGLGGFVLSPTVVWVIQQVGWRASYRIMAAALLVFIIPPLLMFLKNTPADIGEVPDGRAAAEADGAASHVPTGIPAKRAVRTASFWLLFFTYMAQLYVMSAINTNTTLFAEKQAGYDPVPASLFMAVAVLVSVPGRFFYGWITDRIRPQLLMASAGVMLALSTIVLVAFVIRLEIMGYVPIGLFGLAQGLGIAGSTVVLPILVGRCFGDLEFGKIQGLVMAGFAIGVIFGGPSAARIYDTTNSYEMAWIICTVVGIVSMVLALLVRPTRLQSEFKTAEETAAA
jgi:MFS family permease